MRQQDDSPSEPTPTAGPTPIAMAPYFGLRGPSLSRAVIALVVGPAFVTYGYNLSVAGGLLTLHSFVETFPQLDTITTSGDEQHYDSTIQGAPTVPPHTAGRR